MNECSKEKKQAYLAVVFLFINTVIIIFITKYVNIGVVSVYGIIIGIYFMKWTNRYTDCMENLKNKEDNTKNS